MIVFVHGVPETAAIWRKVQAAISQPSIAVALPGFGCALPDGFTPSKDAYAEWLVAQLDAIGEPIDLVGHDWGAGLTYRVATAFGDRLHSWVADVGNIVHPDYVWHDFAKIWQTPGDGEAFFESQAAQPVQDAPMGWRRFSGSNRMTHSRWFRRATTRWAAASWASTVRQCQTRTPIGARGYQPARLVWSCTPPKTRSATQNWPRNRPANSGRNSPPWKDSATSGRTRARNWRQMCSNGSGRHSTNC